VRPAGLLPEEREQFLGYRWFSLEEIRSFPERIEPLELLEIVAELSPVGVVDIADNVPPE
jgi:hypothetical protein